MINRLRKITPTFFRGSAPTPQDVLWLKEHLGIKKIVSLDQASGQHIDRATKILGIEHVMLPINGSHSSLLNFLKHNLKDLFIKGGPTYVHCKEGKDRTGLAVALFKCKYMGMNPEKAIEEAKSLGFGLGVDPKFINLYESIIRSCKPIKNEDANEADIVSNEREYIADPRDSYLNHSDRSSFAPYLDIAKQNDGGATDNPINDQSYTRQNYHPNNQLEEADENNKGTDDPLVGQYDVDGGGFYGAGPVFPAGGFISD